MLAWLPCCAGPDGVPGRIAVVGAPSASRGRRHRHEALGRYNLYRIRPEAPGGPQPWRIELVGRGLAEPDGPVVELDRQELAASVAPAGPAGR